MSYHDDLKVLKFNKSKNKTSSSSSMEVWQLLQRGAKTKNSDIERLG